jgi:uncharacterized protein (TIGR03437 family)
MHTKYRTTGKCPSPSRLISAALVLTLCCVLCPAQVNILTANGGNDRANANVQETLLNPGSVAPGAFGKLAALPVDGQVYTQVLYVNSLDIPGQGLHNVVYVATMQNSVYAFNADATSPVSLLWQVNLGPSVPASTIFTKYSDISEGIGILGTPAIDRQAGVLYVVAEVLQSGAPAFYLHALDLTSGAEKMNGPAAITATAAGAGGAAPIQFDPQQHIQRPGLLLANQAVTIAFGSHSDQRPYHGWLLTYDATNIQRQIGVFATTANGEGGAVWQSGRGLPADDAGNVYAMTGNGDYDGVASFSESFLKFSGGSTVPSLVDWFTPSNWQSLSDEDADLSAGPALIGGTTLLMGADKAGTVYVMDQEAMGHLGGTASAENISQGYKNISQGFIFNFAVWSRSGQAYVYLQGANEPPQCYSVAGGALNTSPLSTASMTPGGLGRVGMTLSADGANDGTGILWETGGDYTDPTAPGTLYAFDASDLSNELWDSEMNPGQDSAGAFAKFANPTVANGKVYLPTLSNAVFVYGLLSGSTSGGAGAPSVSAIVDAASSATGSIAPGEVIVLYGSALGPDTPAGMQLDLNGNANTYLAGTEVLFDGTPAPVLYTSGNQVNSVVPFGLIYQSTQVQIEYQGQLSAAMTVSLVPATPGLFSADGSGSGQGLILNADGTVNSAANPAAAGSTILLFATGGGQTAPAGQDGAMTPETNPPSPLLAVTAQIGGQPAQVLSATGVPDAVQGMIRISVQIPDQPTPGPAVPISITIGGQSSQAGLLVAISANKPLARHQGWRF